MEIAALVRRGFATSSGVEAFILAGCSNNRMYRHASKDIRNYSPEPGYSIIPIDGCTTLCYYVPVACTTEYLCYIIGRR